MNEKYELKLHGSDLHFKLYNFVNYRSVFLNPKPHEGQSFKTKKMSRDTFMTPTPISRAVVHNSNVMRAGFCCVMQQNECNSVSVKGQI